MTSKEKIQAYMKHNKISNLFEELMGKLVDDLPSNPLEFLLKVLQKKAFQRTTKKKEMASTMKIGKEPEDPLQDTEQTPPPPPTPLVAGGDKDVKDRKYQKPWLTNSMKKQDVSRSRKLLKDAINLKKESQAPADPAVDEEKSATKDDEATGKKYKIYGEKKFVETAQESELTCASGDEHLARSGERFERRTKNAQKSKNLRHKTLKCSLAAAKQQEVHEGDSDDVTSGDEETRELCEDFNELRNEGVLQPPKTGVHFSTSRAARRKEDLQAVFNISKFFDNLGGTVSRSHLINVNKSLAEDEEDFESASQVTGPRKPIWGSPGSETESRVGRDTIRNVTTMFDESDARSSVASKSSKKSKTSQMSPGKISGMRAEKRLKPPLGAAKEAVFTKSLSKNQKTRSLAEEKIRKSQRSAPSKDLQKRPSSHVTPK